MATYPGMVKSRGIRSTTVVTAANPATNTPGKMTSAALQTANKAVTTVQDVQDPVKLVKLLGDLQDTQSASTQAQRSNPFSAPCIVRGLSFASNEVKSVPHTLGRPYTDWHPSRVRTNLATLIEVQPTDPGYPPGISTSKILVVKNTSDNTFLCNLVIVGD